MAWFGFLPWLILLISAIARLAPSEAVVLEPRYSGPVTAHLTVAVADHGDGPKVPVTMTVKVEGPPGLDVKEVRLEDPVGAWDAGYQTASTTDFPERRTWVQVIRLHVKKPGASPLPSVSVHFRQSPGTPWEHVDWTDILSRTAPGPRWEQPPPAPPVPDWRPWIAGGGIVLILGIAIVASRWWRRPSPSLTPGQRALHEMEALGGAGRDPVAVHEQVAQVLRSFLGARFGVPAGQRTSDELLKLLSDVPNLPPEQRKQVHSLLARCDTVRFGGRGCTADEVNVLLTEARQFIAQTT